MGRTVDYDVTFYTELSGIDNIDLVLTGLLDHLKSWFSKKSNLLHGMDKVLVNWKQFTPEGPIITFQFIGTMELDRTGFPEYDQADFEARIRTAYEDYRGDVLIVNNEPITRAQQGDLMLQTHLDMNTPFPELTISEMVEGILKGHFLT